LFNFLFLGRSRAAPDIPGHHRQRQRAVLGACHRRLEAAASPASEETEMPPQDQIINAVMARALQADAVRMPGASVIRVYRRRWGETGVASWDTRGRDDGRFRAPTGD